MKVSVGHSLWRLLPFLLLLVVASNPWHSLACGCITPISASIVTWPSPCVSPPILTRTSFINLPGLL